MRTVRAFTFVDAMLALLILLGSGVSLASLSQSCHRSWYVQQEQAVAHALLSQVRFLSPEQLSLFGTQKFDVRGQPMGDGQPEKFTLTVLSDLTDGHTWWTATLTYTDNDGQPRQRIFRRRKL